MEDDLHRARNFPGSGVEPRWQLAQILCDFFPPHGRKTLAGAWSSPCKLYDGYPSHCCQTWLRKNDTEA